MILDKVQFPIRDGERFAAINAHLFQGGLFGVFLALQIPCPPLFKIGLGSALAAQSFVGIARGKRFVAVLTFLSNGLGRIFHDKMSPAVTSPAFHILVTLLYHNGINQSIINYQNMRSPFFVYKEKGAPLVTGHLLFYFVVINVSTSEMSLMPKPMSRRVKLSGMDIGLFSSRATFLELEVPVLCPDARRVSMPRQDRHMPLLYTPTFPQMEQRGLFEYRSP